MLPYPYTDRVIVTAAATEPLTLAQAKTHCKVDADITADDSLITALIVAARNVVEGRTGRVLISTAMRAYGDRFAYEMVVPDPPLVSVSAVKYYDTNGTLTTLSSSVYQVSNGIEPARIWLGYGQIWPAVQSRKQAVHIEYTAGWANAAAVPDALKQAMLLMIGSWYKQRENVITGTIVQNLPVPESAVALMNLFSTGYVW